jgi:hypothetical protein
MTITAHTFARDLKTNPTSCQISPHPAPAVFVARALEVSPHGDMTRHAWLVCDNRLCIEDAMIHADAISPPSLPAVLWPAVVADLEELSGLAVLPEVAA